MTTTLLEAGEITYVEPNAEWQTRAMRRWHFLNEEHFGPNTLAIAATHGGELIGLICVRWRHLPLPLPVTTEAFIDFIEVVPEYRRKGVCRRLVDLTSQQAHDRGAHQIRGWSSSDKVEAIAAWRALGFGLCPTFELHGRRRIPGYQFARPF